MKRVLSVLAIAFIFLGLSFCLDKNTADLISLLSYGNEDYQLIENMLNTNIDLLYIDNTGNKPQSIVYKLVNKIYMDSWDLKNNNNKYQKAVSLLNLYFMRGGKLQWSDTSILYFALHSKMPEIVEILLKNGASPIFWMASDIGSNFRNSPLQEAYAVGDARLPELLIAYGAKDIPEHDKIQIQFIEAAGDISCNINTFIDFIQKKGARINESNINNVTALMKVIDLSLFWSFSPDQMYKYLYLLGNGADPNKTAYCSWDQGYATPLHTAIYYSSFIFKNDPENASGIMVIETLLKAGAFVSATDKWGDTPLHTAAEYNNLLGAKMLVTAGAKIMPKGYKDKTPLDYAQSAEMIKLLKENGATE